MPNNSDSVQQLLAAEKKSSEKINEARKRKQRRLKESKDEAAQEIAKFKLECEQKYVKFEKELIGSKGELEQSVDKTTVQQIDEIRRNVLTTKQRVIKRLVEVVCDVRPHLHVNFNKKTGAGFDDVSVFKPRAAEVNALVEGMDEGIKSIKL